MIFKEKATMRGIFRMRVYKGGELVETFEDHNLIVDGAREQMAHLVAGETTGRKITAVAFGTNGDVPTVDDEEITDAYVKAVDGHSFTIPEDWPFDTPEKGVVIFNWNLGLGEANGKEILEFGLLTEDRTLFARRIRTKALNKESDILLEGEWVITF